VAFFWLLFFSHAKKSDLPKARCARQGRRNPSLKATRKERFNPRRRRKKRDILNNPPAEGGKKEIYLNLPSKGGIVFFY
jgi:hypothetical protein